MINPAYEFERRPKSRFVSLLAVISIAAAMYMIIEGISTLTMLSTFKERSEYRMAEQLMPSITVSPITMLIELFLYGLSIIASIALYNRLQWGRILYISVLMVITLFGIITSIETYISLTNYLDIIGTTGALPMMIMVNILTISINAFVIWKLSTKDIRDEFQSSLSFPQK